MILVIDTASTGLVDWKAQPNAPHQPHLVRLAMTYIDPSTDSLLPEQTVCLMVEPACRIGPDGTAMHGITNESAAALANQSMEGLFEAFTAAAADATVYAGYSVDFHKRVMERTATYLGGIITWPEAKLCIMREAAPIAQVQKQKNGRWAWPKFDDAVPVLLGHEAPGFTGDPFEDGKTRVETIAALLIAIRRKAAKAQT